VGTEARVDRWLWAVRIYKTRSAATEACRGGHVRVNDEAAKPATRVRPGDVVHTVVHGRPRVLEVVRVVEARVGAPVASACLVDHSPPPPPPPKERASPVFAREPGSGRPTKRERRQLDRLRKSAGA
jgi:ribosome-associated heat shock protein Hsp15